MKTRRPGIQARTILIDATTIATLIDATAANIDGYSGGYSATTPGASPQDAQPSQECPRRDCTNERPCYEHGDDVALTSVERLALQSDKAALAGERLALCLHNAAPWLAEAATICDTWGRQGITDTEVSKALGKTVQERLNELWCVNCAKAGISTVHRLGRPECAFCESFRLTGACGLKNPNNHPAPKALLEVHFHRRIDSADIVRTMTATYGPGWNRKVTKKGRNAA